MRKKTTTLPANLAPIEENTYHNVAVSLLQHKVGADSTHRRIGGEHPQSCDTLVPSAAERSREFCGARKVVERSHHGRQNHNP